MGMGQHYNKHGKDMGYGSKKDYEAGAQNFIENNKSTADIFEGKLKNYTEYREPG